MTLVEHRAGSSPLPHTIRCGSETKQTPKSCICGSGREMKGLEQGPCQRKEQLCGGPGSGKPQFCRCQQVAWPKLCAIQCGHWPAPLALMEFGKPRASVTGCAVRNLISAEPGKATGVGDLGEDQLFRSPGCPPQYPDSLFTTLSRL